MTEAWGAVVAAVAAGVFGIAGAFMGLYVGRRQTIDQADVEHGHWLRGQRCEAYVAYLSAYEDAETALGELVFYLPRHVDPSSYSPGQFDQERRLFFETAINQSMGSIMVKLEAVQLLGPAEVAQVASNMGSALSGVTVDIARYGSGASVPDGCEARQADFQRRLFGAADLRRVFSERAKLVIATPPRPQG
ncbi:hypothetical protein ACFC00_38790 [Streptomyces adustus]|uniref:hypothetical protein n=1 Tax=Streptomyces adustus TaxID=1609272 RepID=UPI0035DAD906